MKDDGIDYAAVFRGLPGMVALNTPELVFANASDEFLRMSGRTRERVVGRYLFDVFPDNPNNPAATGMRNLKASLQRVLATGERDAMALQPYDVQSLQRPGECGVGGAAGLDELGHPSTASPTPSSTTRASTPKALPPSCSICSRPTAPPTTPPWSSSGSDRPRRPMSCDPAGPDRAPRDVAACVQERNTWPMIPS